MIDSQFGRASPLPFHLTNILLHLLACGLLFRFLTKMNGKKALAFLFTIAFSAHPVLTPAVAWIPGRNDSLLAVFVLLAFLSFLKFLQTKKWADYAWHILFFALAAFTKETALMVIPISILYLFTLSKEKPFSYHQWILGLGWIITLLFWAGLRSIAVRGHGQEAIFQLAGNALLNFPAVIQVWGKIFFPFNLSILPTIENTTFIYGIISGLALIAALSVSHKVRYPHILFGLGWFLFFLLPTFIPTFAAPGSRISPFMEHRIYLPMMGVITILSEIDWIKESDPGKARHLVPFVLALLLFSGISFFHINDYRDKFSYWKSAVRNSPESAIGHMNLGSAYQTEGQFDQAEAEFKKTLEINPNQAMAYSNLAGIYLEKNMLEEVKNNIKKALAVDPSYAESYYNLGKLHYKQNQLDESEAALKEAIRIKPDHFAAHFGLGIIHMNKSKLKEAEAEFQKSLEFNPFYENSLFNLGMIYAKEGRWKEAEALWLKTIQLKPDHIDAQLQLGIYYYNSMDFPKAIRYISNLRRKGLRIDPKILEQLNIR